MNLRVLSRWLAVTTFGILLGVSQSNAQVMGELFQMMGGMDTVKKLASGFLQSSKSDPRLAGLMGKMNVGTASPKLANEMCSLLGGGCKAPITNQQMAAGAKKFDASQTQALGEHFNSVLGNLVHNPLVKEGVIKVVGPKLGGIVGALL
jgi:hypothetical protein